MSTADNIMKKYYVKKQDTKLYLRMKKLSEKRNKYITYTTEERSGRHATSIRKWLYLGDRIIK